MEKPPPQQGTVEVFQAAVSKELRQLRPTSLRLANNMGVSLKVDSPWTEPSDEISALANILTAVMWETWKQKHQPSLWGGLHPQGPLPSPTTGWE